MNTQFTICLIIHDSIPVIRIKNIVRLFLRTRD